MIKPSQKCLEIGPGKKPLQPATVWATMNVMGSPDLRWDCRDVPYPVPDGRFEVVHASHVLEHVPWYETEHVLKEWHRILAPGGILEVWVPDFGKIARAYYERGLVKKDGWWRNNPDHDPMKWVNARVFNYAGHAHFGTMGTDKEDPNWHKALFDLQYLIQCVRRSGFPQVWALDKVRATGHEHGRRGDTPGWIEVGVYGKK